MSENNRGTCNEGATAHTPNAGPQGPRRPARHASVFARCQQVRVRGPAGHVYVDGWAVPPHGELAVHRLVLEPGERARSCLAEGSYTITHLRTGWAAVAEVPSLAAAWALARALSDAAPAAAWAALRIDQPATIQALRARVAPVLAAGLAASADAGPFFTPRGAAAALQAGAPRVRMADASPAAGELAIHLAGLGGSGALHADVGLVVRERDGWAIIRRPAPALPAAEARPC